METMCLDCDAVNKLCAGQIFGLVCCLPFTCSSGGFLVFTFIRDRSLHSFRAATFMFACMLVKRDHCTAIWAVQHVNNVVHPYVSC